MRAFQWQVDSGVQHQTSNFISYSWFYKASNSGDTWHRSKHPTLQQESLKWIEECSDYLWWCSLKENKTDNDCQISTNEGAKKEKKESTNWFKDKSNSQEPQGPQGHQGLQEGQQFPVMDYK